MSTTTNHKPFDLVVHGATGFTGRLVVEYLLQRYPTGSGLRWAMGGRSAEKLAAVRDEVGAPADTPLVVTDSADPASLQALMAQTRLVLTTVGPYQLYGSELVAACAAAGVDYVDLCGEPAWMRQMIDAHEAAAKASGARIVFSCGFDSIPFDLGVFLLQKEMRARFGHPASRVRGRVRKMKGTFSGGTAASLKATMAAAATNPAVLELLKNPFSLTPGFEGPRQPPGTKPMLDEALGLWVAPFVMAAINTRVVRRSHALLRAEDQRGYGPRFRYNEAMSFAKGPAGLAVATAVTAGLAAFMGAAAIDPLREVLGRTVLPSPGEGPSKTQRDNGSFEIHVVAKTESGKKIAGRIAGNKDPGYGGTAVMLAESAMCLAKDTEGEGAIPERYGVLTPATAMGMTLVKRLRSAGMTLEVHDA